MSTLLLVIIAIVLLLAIAYLFNMKLELKFTKETGSKHSSELDKLSSTEIKVFNLAAKGKSNKEIAEELHISSFTVKKHISNIFKKLGIKSRKEMRQFNSNQSASN